MTGALGSLLKAIGIASALVIPLLAQRPIDLREKGFKSGSELVTTAVTVRDAEGRLVIGSQRLGDLLRDRECFIERNRATRDALRQVFTLHESGS